MEQKHTLAALRLDLGRHAYQLRSRSLSEICLNFPDFGKGCTDVGHAGIRQLSD